MNLASPHTVHQFAREVHEIENLFIGMPDGTQLAARMWLPTDAVDQPVPALLEFLPYRKRDGTVVRDALTHPYLAGHGYACIRVDMRGNGDSDGLMRDEYTQQELDDAQAVIAWLASQAWCTGKVGMFGISWGGFNALQVAALRPPALAAIVTLCSTDDRYEDDIHYKGGTVLNENLGWAATMLAYSSRPPDPMIVGDRWRDMWLQRLEHEPFLLIDWLQHPHRDAYWKHGSVNQDIGAIQAAVLAVGGWNDAYTNAVPRLMRLLQSPRKAIIGPWAHKYPHFAVPGPRIGFLQEMLRWWDQHLKGIATGIMDEPDHRFYIMDAYRPGTFPEHIDGRWVGEPVWGEGQMGHTAWFLNPDRSMGEQPGAEQALSVCSAQTTGFDGGEYCIIWLGPEFPGDQREDDAGSLCFDSPVLQAPLDVVGQPMLDLCFSVDRPVAHVAVRLNDVWPDGAVSRISYHLQNLCMRASRETPSALVPGQRYRMKIKLDDIAWRVPAGHRLRVSISTSYFPMMWPAPEPVTLTVFTGASRIDVPVRQAVADEEAPVWQAPQAAAPVAMNEIQPGWHRREKTVDPATGETRLEIDDDFGEQELLPHGLRLHSVGRERYRIMPNDPLSAVMETHWTESQSRGEWQTRTETFARLSATTTHWQLWAKIEAYEGGQLVFSKTFEKEIERRLQ
jgi:uncharacterized protein